MSLRNKITKRGTESVRFKSWWADVNAFKKQCIDLRKLNYSLSEIVQVTGRPKTSVYFHIRDIPLSNQKLKTVREARRQRLLKIDFDRKGKSVKSFKKFDKWDEYMVSLVAHLIFDGEIKKNGCVYNNRSIALIEKVERCMSKIYKFRPVRYYDKISGVYRTNYYNVALSIYLKKKSEELLSEIIYLSRNLKREFVRAFFDDEGCMDFKPELNTRRIRGYQKKVEILFLVQDLLKDFKIVSSIQLPNEIKITQKENLLRFQRHINFSKNIFMNGKRSNSVWKKHLEKRKILKMALDSYRL